MTNHIFSLVCLFVCLHTMMLSAMNIDNPDNGPDNLKNLFSDKADQISTAWQDTQALGSTALLVYSNKRKIAVTGFVVAVGSACVITATSSYLKQKVKENPTLAISIGGATAGGYLLYTYTSDKKLSRCIKTGFNTVLTTITTCHNQLLDELENIKNTAAANQQQVLDGQAVIKNMAERHREQTRQEHMALGRRLDYLCNHNNIQRPHDILDEEIEVVPLHKAPVVQKLYITPHIEPVAFKQDHDNTIQQYIRRLLQWPKYVFCRNSEISLELIQA